MIHVGPTGKLVTGDVLDMNPRSFEQKLKDYDQLLYLKWNPKKRGGLGVWEIRRRPALKQRVEVGTFEGVTYTELKYQELDLVNHVLDVPVLGVDAILKLQSMDTWKQHDWVGNQEYREGKHRESVESKAEERRRLMAREYKHELRDLKELVQSGFNPAQLSKWWNNV